MRTKRTFRCSRWIVSAAAFILHCSLFVGSATAQKTVYIPDEWRQNRSDTLLYKESDPDNKYTWSKSRSIESDNVIIFWDKYYGTAGPKALSPSNFFYVDMDDLLAKCEAFFELEINQLGFVDPHNSNLSKYKVMVLMNHTTEWTCYGGGYDFEVSALWLNPATCKPVGHSVAHEVGHSFHYMCYAEACGHNHYSSNTIGTGFHLSVGAGQTIWEQTAQWQAAQSYPELMFDQSIGIFRYTHNYAFTHEWHRYQSYWFHYYLNQHYGDIQTVAKVWNQPMTGASDFNQALMTLKGLSDRDLYALYFDYACRLVTWDLDACAPYREPYIGQFEYRCVLTDDDEYQVALASCPQSTGFNVIPLQVPQAGTEVTAHLTGLNPGAALLDADPGEYFNGDSHYVTYSTRRYVSSGERGSRGFRMGYVALMNDGTRRYFSEDRIYCEGRGVVTEDYSITLPEGVSRLWLVVAPALSTYLQHKWDDKIEADDMWPYRLKLDGTDIAATAKVYAAPTLDDRTAADVTFTYDVSFPYSATAYSGVTLDVSGRAAATLGTALQVEMSDIRRLLQDWSSSGPTIERMMFYALDANGNYVQNGSTANGYGHWFSASGQVTGYTSGVLYSEFTPSTLTFALGQYPGRCAQGQTFTVRQALRYRRSRREDVRATFVFNVTVGSTASAVLRSVDYNDPTVGLETVAAPVLPDASAPVYDLSGRRIQKPVRGLYIQQGRKYHVK